MSLDVRNITKSYPGVRALDDVSITFHPGEIHGLLGENGAGKSTLIKAICGIHRPNSGEIALNGKLLSLQSLGHGMDQGITIVNQELQVFSDATVAENIMMDKLHLYKSGVWLDWARLNADAAHYMQLVGIELDPTQPIGPLSAAQKQMIQIAKALSRDAAVILLDEPTSSITQTESRKLFEILTELRAKGVILILVSHKLEEILSICDRVTVLRDGARVGSDTVANLTREKIIKMMVGREVAIKIYPDIAKAEAPVALTVAGMTTPGKIEDASFSLRKGEILGFYGVVGSGRTELAKSVIGHYHPTRGDILVNGKPARIGSVRQALAQYRIGYVSENRKEDGVFLEFDIETNITVSIWQRLAQRWTGYIDGAAQRQVTAEMIKSLDIRSTGPAQLVKTLSGGNQQKVAIAKWLAANCDILFIDEPTAGVDVGAKAMIHDLIFDLALQGKAVVLISSDMPELISLATRILVFRAHKIVGEVAGLAGGKRSYATVSQDVGALIG